MENISNDMNKFAKKTIKVGNLHICYPSFIILVGGLLLSILISIYTRIWFGIAMLGVFLIESYNINCVIVGNCVTWAWVLMIIFVIYFVIGVSATVNNKLIVSSMSKKSSKSSKSSK